MTTDKRAALMKRGLCFVCEKPGHRASDHKAGSSNNNDYRKDKDKAPPPKKANVRQIHELLQALSKGEKEELLTLQVSGDKKEEDDDSDF